MKTLVVAEHVQSALRDVTLELVSAARELGGKVTVAVIADDPAPLTAAVNVEGVDEIVAVRVDARAFENDVYQQALEAVVTQERPDVVLMGFTVDSMGYGPALATKLGLGFASDVFAVQQQNGTLVATRAFYGGKVHAEVDFPDTQASLLLLRPTTWPPAGGEGSAAVTDFPVTVERSRARHVEFVEAARGDVDITTADFLLSIGRGVGEKEAIPELEALAAKMGAVLSVSRPLVDAGWMPNARQVGQSGKTVKAKVYLALGISGAVQHLAGIKGCGTIIAINTDPDAAIFNVAHYGAVADLFEVAEELERLFD